MNTAKGRKKGKLISNLPAFPVLALLFLSSLHLEDSTAALTCAVRSKFATKTAHRHVPCSGAEEGVLTF